MNSELQIVGESPHKISFKGRSQGKTVGTVQFILFSCVLYVILVLGRWGVGGKIPQSFILEIREILQSRWVYHVGSKCRKSPQCSGDTGGSGDRGRLCGGSCLPRCHVETNRSEGDKGGEGPRSCGRIHVRRPGTGRGRHTRQAGRSPVRMGHRWAESARAESRRCRWQRIAYVLRGNWDSP